MFTLHQLNQRRSTPSFKLGLPGPTPEQVEDMLTAALRVPDHGRLTPWRLLAIEGDSRLRLGDFLVKRSLELNPDASEAAQEKDRLRFSRAPLIIAVIATPVDNPKVPEIEQILSAGAVCLVLMQAAQALGFGAQWLTGWAAYDDAVKAHLGLGPAESLVGFIHIGTPHGDVPERRRPEINDHFSTWNG